MILVALEEAAQRGELLLVPDGMLRFRRLRDGSITIREILVIPYRRRTGVGRNLVHHILGQSYGNVVRARCPAKYEANAFWAAMGFSLAGSKEGVNLWEFPR